MSNKFQCEPLDPNDEDFVFISQACWSTHMENIININKFDIAKVVRTDNKIPEWTHGNVLLFHGTSLEGVNTIRDFFTIFCFYTTSLF